MTLLAKRSLTDEVFNLLHQRILAGQDAPGDWLRQEELAVQLGVSQTPVREALDRLVAVGLAERIPFRGVRVPEPQPDEIISAYGTRLLLEASCAYLAALHRTPAQVRALFEMLEQTRPLLSLEEMSALRQLNRRFHLAIATASANPLLESLYEMALNKFPDWRLYEYMFRHPELLQASLQKEFFEHQQLAQALADGLPQVAVHHALNHLVALGQELVTFLDLSPDAIVEQQQAVYSILRSTSNVN